jgi:hypothetical protein
MQKELEALRASIDAARETFAKGLDSRADTEAYLVSGLNQFDEVERAVEALERAIARSAPLLSEEAAAANSLLELLELQRECTAPDLVRKAQTLAVVGWWRARSAA